MYYFLDVTISKDGPLNMSAFINRFIHAGLKMPTSVNTHS